MSHSEDYLEEKGLCVCSGHKERWEKTFSIYHRTTQPDIGRDSNYGPLCRIYMYIYVLMKTTRYISIYT